MARKIIQKYLPDPAKIKKNKSLKVFGNWLHDPRLWHLSRTSVIKAVTVGLFCTFIPVPFQMFIAAAIAIALRINLPISVALVWITNPITIPFLFGLAYLVGAWALGVDAQQLEFELSWEWLSQSLGQIWQPFFLGCFICGLALALIGNITIRLLWRYHVGKNWSDRLMKRKNRSTATQSHE